MGAVNIFENVVDKKAIVGNFIASLDSLIARAPSDDINAQIAGALRSKDDKALKDLRKSSQVEGHHINHVGIKENIPYTIEYVVNNNLANVYEDQFEYAVPYALTVGSNDYVRAYLNSAPASYVKNDKTFAFQPWHYFAAFGGHIDGLKLLFELGYDPVLNDELNKHGWRDAALCGAITTDNLEVFKFLVEEGFGGEPVSIHENWGIVSQAIAIPPALAIAEYLIKEHDYAKTRYGSMTLIKCAEQLQVPQKLDWKRGEVAKLATMFIDAEVDLSHLFPKCHEAELTAYNANKVLELLVSAIDGNIPEDKRGKTASAIIGNWSLVSLSRSS